MDFEYEALNFVFFYVLRSDLKHKEFDAQITSLPNLHQSECATFLAFLVPNFSFFLDLDDLG